jgi:serine/threonine protein kinase
MNLKCEKSGEVLVADCSVPLGKGGEGTIFGLHNNSKLAVKIYKSTPLEQSQLRKLKAMLSKPPEDRTRAQGHASIAWPLELVSLLGGNGEIVGFVMPRLKNVHPLSEFCDVTSRLSLFPGLTYRHSCRIARNLASAVTAIHESGSVIGDVNESNIMATEDALVSLVDTDSFQIVDQATGEIYHCPVGIEMYTPPESSSVTESPNPIRTTAHDLFGIGVLFFQLLMEGTRPFTGVYRGPGEIPSLDKWIPKGYFPFDGHADVAPPPLAPPFKMLHPKIQTLFRDCFLRGHADPQQRPDASSWYQTLKEAEKSLLSCESNPQHLYFSHNSRCPWCERIDLFRARGVASWDSFPAPSNSRNATQNPYWSPSSSTGRATGSWSTTQPQSAPPQGTPLSVPSVFFRASSTNVTVGEPITLQWSIPTATSVRITRSLRQTVFAGHTPNGSVDVYPTKDQTYRITTIGTGPIQLAPISVLVRQVPEPVSLKQTGLGLKELVELKPVSSDLRTCLALRNIGLRLTVPMRLRHHLPLRNHGVLNEVTVELSNYCDTA